jgi:putative hydrolase of the HAD superfamily
MKKPKMILFDYGQTLISEDVFDGVKGTRAVLEQCVLNPLNISAEEVQSFANELNKDIGRYYKDFEKTYLLEVHNHPFQNYLYEYFHIKRLVSPLELEMVFWDNSAPARPTNGVIDFLSFLNVENIRTGVISNIGMSGAALKSRIDRLLPDNSFEFIIATSEYVFRKPHKRIFEIALRKASLEPSDVWYCGDNIYCDVEGAQSVGIMPIWYTGAIDKSPKCPYDDCLEIKDWHELSEYFS